ncbi:MAG: 4-hydroxy-tetrahydrodipicolinate synthase [Actinobacteria bacterium]|nr:4-hydroxy-tetrahydrodipicolinate synthase [Actinomycetota bacterium]
MSRSTPRFGALSTAMVSPFLADGSFDADGAVKLARWLVDHGSDGLVLAGSTGEGPVLSDEEKRVLWSEVAQNVTVPVMAATGTADTRHTVEMTRMAQECKVDGILLVTPYYLRPSQQGLFEHFKTVSEATSLPVLLYDIPSRTGRRIAIDTTLRLVNEVENIIGIKDATGDIPSAARLIANAPGYFEMYSGDDSLTLPFLSIGAVGLISVAGHWAGEELSQVISAFKEGRPERAATINATLIESYLFETSETFPNPLPAKAACRVLGLPSGQCRPPLGSAPTELDGTARQVLARLGKIHT